MSNHANEFPGGVIAASSGSQLHIWKPLGDSFKDIAVNSTAPPTTVAWNRNNKVVAVGREDGTVQLCYSNGDAMSTLSRDNSSATLTSLSWSLGSKRLAAGSTNGKVCVHDMTTKTSRTLPGQFPVSAVEFHPEDKFLAVASNVVTLYNPQMESIGALPSSETSQRTCLTVSAIQPVLAAGTETGSFTIWDSTLMTSLTEQKGRHRGGFVGVQFAPLDPATLVSAGAEGMVKIWDRRLEGDVGMAAIGSSGLRCLSVKEDFSMIAAGTTDGGIYIYDPRNLTAPIHRLRCNDGRPIRSIHWQHNYQSLAQQHKSTTNNNSEEVLPRTTATSSYATASPSFGMMPGANNRSVDKSSATPTLHPTAAPHRRTATTARDGDDEEEESSASPSESMAVSLDGKTSPPGQPGNTAAQTRRNSVLLQRGGGNFTTTTSQHNRTTPTVTVPSDPLPLTDDVPRVDSPLNPNEQRWAIPAVTPGVRARMMQETVAAVQARRESAAHLNNNNTVNQHMVNNNNNGAASSGGDNNGATATTTNVGPRTEQPSRQGRAGTNNTIRHMENTTSVAHTTALRPHNHALHHPPTVQQHMTKDDEDGDSAMASPKKTPLLPIPPPRPLNSNNVPATTTRSNSNADSVVLGAGQPAHGLREDILALHLDMLTQFQEVQASNAATIAALMQRQDTLAREMEALRGSVERLLNRRDDVLWL